MTRHLPVTGRPSVARRLALTAAAAASVLAGVVIPAVNAAPARADTDDFSFASFDADYYLEKADDGSSRLRTVETLVAEFPDFDQNRGIIRAIPLDFEGADLGVAVESVTDADGTDVPYTESDDDGFREVSIGTDEFVRGEQIYVITYDQRNVIRAYDDTDADEFYWDLNGTGWGQSFGSVTGRVHVPDDLVGALTGTGACYYGDTGSTDSCVVEQAPDEDGMVFTVSAEQIGPEQTVTVAVGFEQGTFTEPERAVDQPWVVIIPAVIAFLGLVLAGGGAVLRFFRWRDAPGRGTIVAQYERPRGIDLLEAGELASRTRTSMSAQLMDLAVRGNLRIIDRTTDRAQKGGSYSLEFTTFDGLDESERKVMRAVFGASPERGARKRIGTSAKTGRSLHKQVVDARKRVIERGLRRAVSNTATAFIFIGAVLLFIIAVVVLIVLSAANAVTPAGALLLVGAIVLSVVATLAIVKRSTVTADGATIRDHLKGVKEYIQLAEADRLRMLQSPEGAERRTIDASDPAQVVRVYEKLLPFAILFGVEKEWSRELERLYSSTDASPGWYSGDRPFSSGTFAGFVGASMAQTSSTWSSSGSGSSYGGSTGGGFAGGGGGGGGGGGR